MSCYLKRVATAYYNHFDTKITDFSFVFPNKRAGVFFQKYLSEITDKPLFSPEIFTINECVVNASTLHVADKCELLFRLYHCFSKLSTQLESFDSFVFFGELLIADFNEVDAYLMDAEMLFQNLSEIKDLDTLDYLTENQLEVISAFWNSFKQHQSESRDKFIQIWQILYPLYMQWKAHLMSDSIGYEGMIFRDLIERLTQGETVDWFQKRKFVFVGFNALNPCEKALMTYLQKRDQADFYWDYESIPLQDPHNPASAFFFKNVQTFPSLFDISITPEPLEQKHFEHIPIGAVAGQAQYMYRLLSQLYPSTDSHTNYLHTAILLPDEQLLFPVLHAIPSHISKVNVTMGYPLKMSAISGLVHLIFELHIHQKTIQQKTYFYHKQVLAILNHSIVMLVDETQGRKLRDEQIMLNRVHIEAITLHKSPILSGIFREEINAKNVCGYMIDLLLEIDRSLRNIEKPANNNEFESSFLYQMYITFVQLDKLLQKYPNIVVTLETLFNLIKGITGSMKVPFVGEPLNGLQIMGVLEARGLDFDNLIIPSFNEGSFPKSLQNISLIPYHLRKGYGLPTYELHESIISCNFYRLIHRAKNIYFLSETKANTGKSNEISRFYYQLKYLYDIPIKETRPFYELELKKTECIQIEKNSTVLEKLNRFIQEGLQAQYLSASSLNMYLNCPLQFYFRVIEELEEEDEISETIKNDVFGNIFHQVMARLYKPLEGMKVEPHTLNHLLNKTEVITLEINKAFSRHFYKDKTEQKVELNGSNLLISKVIYKYVRQVIQLDMKYAPFYYHCGEKLVKGSVTTKFGNVRLKGYIDRVDEKNELIRILDYKTGKGSRDFKTWEQVFDPSLKTTERPGFVLQTFLYSYLYAQESQLKSIIPGIFYLRKVYEENFETSLTLKNPNAQIGHFHDHEKDFLDGLVPLLEEIMDSTRPFVQTEQLENCTFCSFKCICGRA